MWSCMDGGLRIKVQYDTDFGARLQALMIKVVLKYRIVKHKDHCTPILQNVSGMQCPISLL